MLDSRSGGVLSQSTDQSPRRKVVRWMPEREVDDGRD